MSENVGKILIVEDDRLSSEYLKEILEDEGYNIVGITSEAEDSIVLANSLKPDLILMDIILNGQLTGCEAAIKIKQNQKKCKIIFLTAYAEKEMIDYATLAHANSYLLKPYRDEEILATIAVVLSQDKPIKMKIANIIKLEHNFSFDFIKQHLLKNGIQIPINEQKTKLIELLVNNLNTTVSNEQICYTIWGENKSDSTLRSLIHRTKKSLQAELIHNANGVGYIIKSA